MKIQVRGYPVLEIPEAFLAHENGPFGSATPYVAKVATRVKNKSYLQNKLPSKLLCLEALRRRMEGLGSYASFSEPLAGIGLSARLFEKGPLRLNDFDEGCRGVLKHNFPDARITSYDAFQAELPLADVTFLDFNDFTFKRWLTTAYKDVLSRGLRASTRFLVLNDCSIFYFRYGASSYAAYSKLLGREIHVAEDYFKTVAEVFRKEYPDWYVIHAAYFRDTSFLLFSRKKAKFGAERIEAKPIVSVGSQLFA